MYWDIKVHHHKLIIEGEKGRLEYDFALKKVNIFVSKKRDKIIHVSKDNNNRFVKEISYFVNLIKQKKQPPENLTLESGIRFLQFMKKYLE